MWRGDVQRSWVFYFGFLFSGLFIYFLVSFSVFFFLICLFKGEAVLAMEEG